MAVSAQARKNIRNAMIAKVHIAKKYLRLDDAAYRALLSRVTGKRSAADCTDQELLQILAEFKAKGFRPQASGTKGRKASEAETRYLPKLRALWLSGWNLGVVKDPSDEAMIAFVKRQTGLDHVRFMQRSQDAARAIEGLKSWLAREANVDWGFVKDDPRACVVAAQWQIICRLAPIRSDEQPHIKPEDRTFYGLTFQWAVANAKDALINDLGDALRSAWTTQTGNTKH